MKPLSELLVGLAVKKILGNTAVRVQAICFDARQAGPGTVFVAIPGTQVDGHAYIDQALAAGSLVIVAEQLPSLCVATVTYVVVADSATALSKLAAHFYDHPATKLQLVAVTGTNGKTSTVHLLHGLFQQLGYTVGMLSTIHNALGQETVPAYYTTPDPVQLHHLLARMVEQGCQYCFMEASSHGMVQERMAGLKLAGAVFLNITHDHLDYHTTMAAYRKAKKKLFDELPAEAFALVNADDPYSAEMVQHTPARSYTFGLKKPAQYTAQLLSHTLQGLTLRIAGQSVASQLVGALNAYNLVAAYATACLLGESPERVRLALATLPPIPGRMQCLHTSRKFTVLIDYAHTPDALQQVLQALHGLKQQPSKIITVLGCGGNRDTQKRPLMAQIAYQGSDYVILTSDNPRYEAPEAIIAAMQAGLDPVQQQNVQVIVDRAAAIQVACNIAKPHDMVLIAGKGHETYQEIQGKKLPFEDKKVVEAIVDCIPLMNLKNV